MKCQKNQKHYIFDLDRIQISPSIHHRHTLATNRQHKTQLPCSPHWQNWTQDPWSYLKRRLSSELEIIQLHGRWFPISRGSQNYTLSQPRESITSYMKTPFGFHYSVPPDQNSLKYDPLKIAGSDPENFSQNRQSYYPVWVSSVTSQCSMTSVWANKS